MSEMKPPARRFYPLTPWEFFRNPFPPKMPEDWFGKGWLEEIGTMRSDLKETDTAYIIESELPGFKKENISVEYKGDTLVISAIKQEETKEEKENYIRRERHYGEASRRFKVEGINSQDINAEYKDGVLKVTLPKIEPSTEEKKKIEIL